MGRHLRRWIGPEQFLQRLDHPGVLTQPPSISLRVKDDGHPVMHGPKHFVSLGREDGAGLYHLPFLVSPTVPQSREAEQSPVAHGEEEGQLPFPLAPPLVEPIRRDDASPPLECLAEGWLRRDRFATRVDETRAHRVVLRPGRDQSPLEHCGFALVLRLPHRQDALRRRDVEARLDDGLLPELKLPLDPLLRRSQGESSAHLSIPLFPEKYSPNAVLYVIRCCIFNTNSFRSMFHGDHRGLSAGPLDQVVTPADRLARPRRLPLSRPGLRRR